MFEYTSYDLRKVSINPRFITHIEENGSTMCNIYLTGGSVVIVKEPYDVVKQHIANYLPAQ